MPAQEFVNWETPHVSPLAHDAATARLLVCNTPDNRLEVFDTGATGGVTHLFDVPVGLDPVTVRFRTPNEAWVVNAISDSISVVDLTERTVIRTIETEDEPADVVFAGTPTRAYVSCGQTNAVLVFDPLNPVAPLSRIAILGEEPRALAISADGAEVYVAIFESGNGSTILGGGLDTTNTLALRNVVSDPLSPYAGVNPPPNDGANFSPAQAAGNPTPPRVGLIVKKDGQNRWMDDNGGNWADLVSGPNAARSNRPIGWDVTDHDVAIIDTQTSVVRYADRLMNINMALAVHPTTGSVTVVGTDATNEIRFEPNVNAVFLRVLLGIAPPTAGAANTVVDMNPHLDYSVRNVPQVVRDVSLGDPRGIAWRSDGARGFVTGMGSNNVVVMDGNGGRVGRPIEVGEGPTGIALDEGAGRLYTVNKFDASISVVDLGLRVEIDRIEFHDPSPEAIKVGRRHLYSTHDTSGLGHVSCASCHVDARNDRLAWDLGNPAGSLISDNDQNKGMNLPGLNQGFEDFHPMKGPMTTQTLVDIIGKEPLHWRGDRDHLGDFSPAFVELQGDDAEPSPTEVGEFSDFLSSLFFPPNPFRNFDNTLPTSVPLTGHFSVGRFSPAGTPLPAGNATLGLARYMPPTTLDGPFACVTCHTMPTGLGANFRFQGTTYVPFPPGPEGEAHHALVSVDGSTNRNIKVAQLRALYKKVGMDLTQTSVQAGFGFLHDGSIPSLAHFLSSPTFEFQNDQQLADMIAFMLSFAGSDLPSGATNNILFPPGTASQDTHAGVGTQTTIVDYANAPQTQVNLVQAMIAQASLGRVGLVAKYRAGSEHRGAVLLNGSSFQTDRATEQIQTVALLALATPADPLTFTVVPLGSQERIGVDRDGDGFFDRDEKDAGSNPANPRSIPSVGTSYCSPAVPNSTGAPGVASGVGSLFVTDNDFTLVASNLPSNQFGFFVGSETQGFTANPGGSLGNLCLGSNIARFTDQIGNAGPGGSFAVAIDLERIPTNPAQAVFAGETWNFQAWFRDTQGPQAVSNFTDGLSATFN